MIVLEIRHLGCTNKKSNRWKVLDGRNTLVVESESYTPAQAARAFVVKHWPDCEVRDVGQLPNNGDHIATVAIKPTEPPDGRVRLRSFWED